MNNYLAFDKSGSLCYEGFRNNYNGVNGLAMGDATAMFGQPCDLSLYSSAFIGALGGMVSETNVKGILQIDLNKTDSFGVKNYENFLYYNPFETSKIVNFNGGNNRYDLFDATTKQVVARNVTGNVNISVPAKSSRVIVVLPANSNYERQADKVVVNNIPIAKYFASLDTNLHTRQELTSDSEIKIDYKASMDDEVESMQIFFNEIEAYNGVPIKSFKYNKSILPDTDYILKITIETKKGIKDTIYKFIVAR